MVWPFRRVAARSEARAIQTVPDTDFARLTGKVAEAFSMSAADVQVTLDKALGVPSIWGAVNFLSGTIAGMPLRVGRRRGDVVEWEGGGVARLLQEAASDEQTAFDWKKYTVEQVLTGGRAITFIERAPSGRVLNLWALDPETVTIRRDRGRTTYEERRPDGRSATYEAAEIIDLPFMLKRDRLSHYSPIMANRDVVGLAIASTLYASKYFQGGGVPPFAVTGGFQSGGAMARAAEDLELAVKKAATERRPALVLPSGLEIKAIGANPEDGQMLELKRFVIEEVGRIYSLPPIFLQDLTHGSFANTEQQDLHFVKHTVKRWAEQMEQELTLKLFGRGSPRFVEFDLDGLLRGDFKTRMEGHALAVQNGLQTPNEGRQALGRAPLDGGNNLMIQGATVPIVSQPTAPASAGAPTPTDASQENDGDDI